MGLYRTAVAAMAILAALVMTPIAQASWNASLSDQGKLSVEINDVRCHDLSALASLSPLLGGYFSDELRSVATVSITIRSDEQAHNVPFTVLVDGQPKSSGIISGGGSAHITFSIPDSGDTRIKVVSRDTTVADRALTPHC